jgi:phosphocarrier protein HPr
MIEKDYIIMSPEGIHARPATALVRLTKRFKSSVSMKRQDRRILLNSMLNILSLGAKGGDTITIVIEGEDEAGAAEAIDLFFMQQLKDL